MNKVEKMRAEVTTTEQFVQMGGTNAVAKRYQVSYPTAHKHYQALKEREQIAPELPLEEEQGTSLSNPSSEVVVEFCEPSRREIELFFTDAEHQPVLPVQRSDEELLQQVIDRITERVTEKNREAIRAWFVTYHMQVNDLIAHALTISDKLVGQLRSELLDEIECGVLTVLNREVR